MGQVVVVGGGASGMVAAGRAAECGAHVVLLERNSILGKKLRITGKGRGNVTNIADLDQFVAAFGPNGKFLYGAFSRFSNNDLVDLLRRVGVGTKVERGGRVFTSSDRAADVAEGFERWLCNLGVDIRLGVRCQSIVTENGEIASVKGVSVFSSVVPAEAVVLATGGITYPRTGSTGDGYRIAAELGHTIVTPRPSLGAFEVGETWVKQLQGLSLRNVEATLYVGKKKVRREFGEMVFTHFGVSGPIVLTLSKAYAGLHNASDVSVSVDLKPALSQETLDARLTKQFKETTKQLKNYLPELLPRSLVPVFLQLVGIESSVPVNRITREERMRIVNTLKDLRMRVVRARSAEEAIVTAGGISLREIDPRTMESKLIRGLYFAGEVMDIDAVTGGFNLQAAFSTGWLAGESAAGRVSSVA